MALTQIKTGAIADDAVTASKIPANAIGASELADNAVDTAAIASNAVTSAKVNVPLHNRNLIINGAMQVAQRGTSGTTTSSGYYAVDRMRVTVSGLDEGITVAQSALTSSDTPYTKGFRSATKITNGNQTSGAGASDNVGFMYRFEGQDINSSGWEYTNSSSFVTISFWIKSSVAQTFYLRFRMTGSSVNKEYVSAVNATTSWQKITKTIPGATGVDSVNTYNEGAFLILSLFDGTDRTGSMTIDQWNTFSSSTIVPDMTSTWYTTNDATFEITGLQLEVGSVATDFEHRSIGQELELCKRYYQVLVKGNQYYFGGTAYQYSGTLALSQFRFTPAMRVIPTLVQTTGTDYYTYYINSSSPKVTGFTGVSGIHTTGGALYVTANVTSGYAGAFFTNNASASIAFAAEL